MLLSEKYLKSVEKSRFLLVCETGEAPGVFYRFDPACSCLLAEKTLASGVPPSMHCGSVLFTLDAGQRPLRALLLYDGPAFQAGSILWCVPVGTVRFSPEHVLLLARLDAEVCPHSPADPWKAAEAQARFYAEHILNLSAPSVEFETEETAEALVENGLHAYKLKQHFRLRF